MWQVAIAAAVAGSGILARNLFHNATDHRDPTSSSSSSTTTNTAAPSDQTQKCDLEQQLQENHHHYAPSSNLVLEESPNSSTPLTPKTCIAQNLIHEDEEKEEEGKDRIFRFSSSGSRDGGRSRSVSKSLKKEKKLGIGVRGSSGNAVEFQNAEKRISVCLKKRRTAKNASANCGSRSSKDSSVFGWGVGVGIMYMMSAGKAEISKLNTAMDETAKVVHELKAELYKRKSSHSLQVSGSVNQADTTPKKFKGKRTRPVLSRSISDNRDINDINVLDLPVTEDGECASSVLTEEPGPEVLEINELEAELESELQKLSCCSTFASRPEGITLNFCEETEISDNGIHEQKEQNSSSNQFHGVPPFELDRKLSRLLIGQQESQIVELESELQSAHAKLNKKEAELQALKDCVKRLTEFSLSTVSDNELEVHMEQENFSNYDHNSKMAPESNKLMVGMKRANGS